MIRKQIEVDTTKVKGDRQVMEDCAESHSIRLCTEKLRDTGPRAPR